MEAACSLSKGDPVLRRPRDKLSSKKETDANPFNSGRHSYSLNSSLQFRTRQVLERIRGAFEYICTCVHTAFQKALYMYVRMYNSTLTFAMEQGRGPPTFEKIKLSDHLLQLGLIGRAPETLIPIRYSWKAGLVSLNIGMVRTGVPIHDTNLERSLQPKLYSQVSIQVRLIACK